MSVGHPRALLRGREWSGPLAGLADGLTDTSSGKCGDRALYVPGDHAVPV